MVQKIYICHNFTYNIQLKTKTPCPNQSCTYSPSSIAHLSFSYFQQITYLSVLKYLLLHYLSVCSSVGTSVLPSIHVNRQSPRFFIAN